MVAVAVLQCQSCGGVYRTIQADGTEYYHACPPAKITKGATIDPVTGKVITPAVFTPVANRRDENIGGVDAQGKGVIKNQGGGAVAVTDPAVIAAVLNPEGIV